VTSGRAAPRLVIVSLIVLSDLPTLAQEAPPPNDEFRYTVTFGHPIVGPFSGEASAAVFDEVDKDTTSYRLSTPNVRYDATSWFQGWGGAIYIWNDNRAGDNSHEVRPFVGVKLSAPNPVHLHLYNLTRFEWRFITQAGSDTTQLTKRLRSRFGVEFPLSERAWDSRTFYGSTDVEPIADLTGGFIEDVRFEAATGYIVSDRLRLEFQYTTQLTRGSSGEPLTFGDNLYWFNVKFSFAHGLVESLIGPD
jgi:hypothetical protein